MIYLCINMQMGIGTARVGEPVVTPDLGMCDSAPGELRVLAGGGVRHALVWVLPVSAGVLRVPARLSLSGCIFCISPTVSPGQSHISKATKPQSLHFTYPFSWTNFSWKFAFCSHCSLIVSPPATSFCFPKSSYIHTNSQSHLEMEGEWLVTIYF